MSELLRLMHLMLTVPTRGSFLSTGTRPSAAIMLPLPAQRLLPRLLLTTAAAATATATTTTTTATTATTTTTPLAAAAATTITTATTTSSSLAPILMTA